MKTVWSSDPVMRGLSLPSTKRSSSTGHLSFKISTFSNVSSMPFQWDSRLYTDQDWISQTETFPNLSGRPFGTHLPVCGPWPEAFIWQEIPLSKKYLCRKYFCKKEIPLSKERNTLVKKKYVHKKNVYVRFFVILTVQYLCKNGNSTLSNSSPLSSLHGLDAILENWWLHSLFTRLTLLVHIEDVFVSKSSTKQRALGTSSRSCTRVVIVY